MIFLVHSGIHNITKQLDDGLILKKEATILKLLTHSCLSKTPQFIAWVLGTNMEFHI